ncbi:MAG: Trp biosynthesis-associated membrane protein [Actinomycetota bacterium]|nr:Trp biosynthesis-associated membrane protein [Actinomycetota bacterium]
MRSRLQFGAALSVELLAAVATLLIATRSWQTILTSRPRPLVDDLLEVSGRTLDAAPTALGLVALAGVVAVLATKGVVRRIVGLVLALAGGAVVWRSVADIALVSTARARELVSSHHSAISVSAGGAPHVSGHPYWPWLSVVCGALIAVAGAAIATRGQQWAVMSARYEAPVARVPSAEDAAITRARADASMWTALDRGDDPTRGDADGDPHAR